MKQSEILEKIGADTINKRNGIYTVRKSYFYTFGKSTKNLKYKVLKAFPYAEIIDYGNHCTPFRGGQSVRDGSHWYVSFRL